MQNFNKLCFIYFIRRLFHIKHLVYGVNIKTRVDERVKYELSLIISMKRIRKKCEQGRRVSARVITHIQSIHHPPELTIHKYVCSLITASSLFIANLFLHHRELHGQKPVVTHVSKQNLIMFENQSKKSKL